MEVSGFQFVGAPCLQHSNYVFYKTFSFKSHNRIKILTLGDFFFLKILQDIPTCIGEVELLWEDKASGQLLSSIRLYFRPEHTPKGRKEKHGKDEVIAVGERVILRLDDLVPLIQEDVKWSYGSSSPCSAGAPPSHAPVEKGITNGINSDSEEKKVIKTEDESLNTNKLGNGCDASTKNGFVVKNENDSDKENAGKDVCSGAANIAVMNFARYCRYRAMCKRLEGCENEWLHVAVVVAIGGYSSRKPGCTVMYCRKTFYQPEIDDWDCRMDHMLPSLKTKGRPKKKKVKTDSTQDSDSMEEIFANVAPSVTSSSRPRRSTEPGETNDDKVCTNEQAFLIGLHNFMHDAKMPIGRIPSLGFKQIDLYYFFKQADKLGGYDSITHKRMWKHLYDKLGGNSSNTSAATCTRKHYERLLLPYERHLRKIKALKNKKQGEDKRSKAHRQKEDPSNQLPNSNEKRGWSEDTNFASEHSKYQNADTEVLEIPVIRNRVSAGNGVNSKVSLKPSNGDSGASPASALTGFPPGLDGLTFAQLEQLQQQALATGDPAAVAYANMLYQSGYLMPLPIQHMLQSQWGPLLTGHPSVSSLHLPPSKGDAGSDQSGPSPQTVKKSNQKDMKSANQSSSQSNQHPSLAHHNLSSSSHPPSKNSNSSGVKPAHSNTPYVPSPYLLNDYTKAGSSKGPSRRPHPYSSQLSDNAANSQKVASILHPVPAGHRSEHSRLPPAPTSLYLDPASQNPFSLPPPTVSGSPPAAHSFTRKRLYPFDNPGVFPSPDMVLDQIKSSARLPNCGNRPTSVHTNCKQHFDNPRDILQHSQQSFLASQENNRVGVGQHRPNQTLRKQTSLLATANRLHQQQANKSKNGSKRMQGSASGYSPTPVRKTAVDIDPSSRTDQGKMGNNSNGYMAVPNSSKVSPAMHADSPMSSKDGRLTSALFGTQFTAMPRPTKPSDLGAAFASDPSVLLASTSSPSASSLPSSAAVLNPHLHPAFVSPFVGVPGASSSGTNPAPGAALASPVSPASAASSSNLAHQLQMLAEAYGPTSAQLAAYEEMLRQNGYGAFVLPPGMSAVPSLAAHHPHSVAVASGISQQSKGSKKH